MKIERLNDRQIKCTLTQSDLANHDIRVSELAYGSEKARSLFREMMKKANAELGFEIEEHMPIMVEAIPESKDSLVLIISKVDNPDDIDTRFSKMSPPPLSSQMEPELPAEGADDIIDLFQKLKEKKNQIRKETGDDADGKKQKAAPSKAPKKPIRLMRLYHFDTLDEVIAASRAVGDFYQGENRLFRNAKSGEYQLVIHQSSHTPEEFNKVTNILSEYAAGTAYNEAAEAFLAEHEITVLKKEALQTLTRF